MLEASAVDALYGGQFALRTQEIRLNYLVTPLIDVSLETYPP